MNFPVIKEFPALVQIEKVPIDELVKITGHVVFFPITLFSDKAALQNKLEWFLMVPHKTEHLLKQFVDCRF